MAELRGIDLNLLVVFQHLLEDRNISSVARRLNLSQPAVSNALRRLRSALGDELFVRTANGMQPTPYAERLGGPVGEALALLSHTLDATHEFHPEISTRRFRIAMSDVGEIHFMPRLMEQCSRYSPGIRIDSLRLSGTDLRREMDAGRVDLAIGAFDNLGSGFMQKMLFRQGYATLFRLNHPTVHEGITLKAFRAERHLVVSHAAPYGQVNQSLEKAGVKLDAHFSVPHFSAVPYIVSTTDLLATVPKKLADTVAAHFPIGILVPPIRVPALQTNLYWHRRFHLDRGNQWLRAMMVNTFADDV